MKSWETVNGETLERLSCVDLEDSLNRYGGECMAVHRVDLYNELLRLATEGEGFPASLRLGAKVVSGDDGSLLLNNGERLEADLIIGADGLHSVVRDAVLGPNAATPTATVISAFRSLIPTDKLENAMTRSEALHELVVSKNHGSTILADTTAKEERHIVWYGCRGGEVQNVVGVHSNRPNTDQGADHKASLLAEFGHFSPGVLELLKLAEEVSCWRLYDFMPFSHWTSHNAVLIGDAAHPMLPFGGQAANQAMEDAGALGVLFKDVSRKDEIGERLRLFEEVRRGRSAAIQILSSRRVGREKEVEAELRQFATGEIPPTTFEERLNHAYGYDVLKASEEKLESFQGLNIPPTILPSKDDSTPKNGFMPRVNEIVIDR